MNIVKGTFPVDCKPGAVSYLFEAPEKSKGMVVFAHGAGAPMTHGSMQDYTDILTGLGLAVFRFNFGYLENGKGGPSKAPVLTDTIRRAVDKSKEVYKDTIGKSTTKIWVAGKSMGGRMASLAEAEQAMGIKGLLYFGFPLHAPGKIGIERAAHLKNIQVPMLFIQGTRDTFAKVDLITEVTDALEQATLYIVESGDHSHKVLKRSGVPQEQAYKEIQQAITLWIKK
ncbi:MAG: dienelactone hydrolase family protein [Fibrobacterales bacterium]